jgi:hypothetical protein
MRITDLSPVLTNLEVRTFDSLDDQWLDYIQPFSSLSNLSHQTSLVFPQELLLGHGFWIPSQTHRSVPTITLFPWHSRVYLTLLPCCTDFSFVKTNKQQPRTRFSIGEIELVCRGFRDDMYSAVKSHVDIWTDVHTQWFRVDINLYKIDEHDCWCDGTWSAYCDPFGCWWWNS